MKELLLATALCTSLCPAAVAATGEVTLYRDRYGTPHIYADREEDGFYALGYAWSEDRLQQLLFQYLQASGNLAAKFGPGPLDPSTLSPELAGYPGAGIIADMVESDLNMRRYRYLADARINFAKLSPQTRADITAFFEGMQKYMAENPAKVPAWAPRLEPALMLAGSHFEKEDFTIRSGKRACQAAVQAAQPGGAGTKTSGRLTATDQGSNGWVIGKSRTADGSVIHAGDSHDLFAKVGTAFYNWRMKAGSYDFIGFDAMSAFPLFGHSPYFAWTWTDYANNNSDCYAIKTNASDPVSYMVDGKARKLVFQPYNIEVKGAKSVTGNVEYAKINGVLAPVVARHDGIAYAVATPFMHRPGFALDTLRSMALAKTGAEFKKALATRELFPDNLLAGGADGTILWFKTGREPIRPRNGAGVDALDGNTSKTAWLGLYSFDKMMRIENPNQGYVSNSNVSPDHMYPQPFINKADWPKSYVIDDHLNKRQRRIIDLLSKAQGVTPAQAMDFVFDEKIPDAELWSPAIGAAIEKNPAIAKAAGAEFKRFADRLKTFDGVFSKDSYGALYHVDTRMALLEESPEQIDAISTSIEAKQPLTSEQETILVRAAISAFAKLQKKFGTIDKTFGDVNRFGRGGVSLPAAGVAFPAGLNRPGYTKYPVVTANGLVELNIEDSLRLVAYDTSDPTGTGERFAFAGQRHPFVTVFSNPVQSYSAIAYGVSDDPKSKHYSDQAVVLSERRLKPTYFNLPDLLKNLESWKTLVRSKQKPN